MSFTLCHSLDGRYHRAFLLLSLKKRDSSEDSRGVIKVVELGKNKETSRPMLVRLIWVVLGMALFGIPLVYGKPAGDWVPGAFGSTSFVLLVGALLFPGARVVLHRVPPLQSLAALALAELILGRIELFGIAVITTSGVAGLESSWLYLPALPPVNVMETMLLAESILSNLALVIWIAVPFGGRLFSSVGEPMETDALSFVVLLVLAFLLGIIRCALPTVANEYGRDLAIVSLVSAVLTGVVCALLFKFSGSLVVCFRSKRLHVGECPLIVGLALLCGCLVWSIWDAVAWVWQPVSTGEASIRLMVCSVLCAFVVVPLSTGRFGLRPAQLAANEGADDSSNESIYASHMLESLRGVETLSRRELYVVGGTLSGLSQSEMANAIGVGISTIASYRSRAYRKLGVASKDELLVLMDGPTGPRNETVGGSFDGEAEKRIPCFLRSGITCGAVATLGLVLMGSLPESFALAFFLAGFGLVSLANVLTLRFRPSAVSGVHNREGERLVRLLLCFSAFCLMGINSYISDLATANVSQAPPFSILYVVAFPAGVLGWLMLRQSRSVLDEEALASCPSPGSVVVAMAVLMAAIAISVLLGRVALTVYAFFIYAVALIISDGPREFKPALSSDVCPEKGPGFWCIASFLLAFLIVAIVRTSEMVPWQLKAVPISSAFFFLMFALNLLASRACDQGASLGIAIGSMCVLGKPLLGLDWGYLVAGIACVAALASLGFLALALRDRSTQDLAEECGGSPEGRLESYFMGRGLGELQAKVMVLTFKGYGASSISDMLCIALSTVSSYRARSYRRLGIHGRRSLVRLVREEVYGNGEMIESGNA